MTHFDSRPAPGRRPMTDEELDHSEILKGHKHRGRTPALVAEIDPKWLVWAYETWDPKPCSKLLYDECVKEIKQEEERERIRRAK